MCHSVLLLRNKIIDAAVGLHVGSVVGAVASQQEAEFDSPLWPFCVQFA